MAKVEKPPFMWPISQKDAPPTGPYLSAALFAKDVLTDRATKFITVKHIVGAIKMSPNVLQILIKDAPLSLPMSMMISFAAGGFKGDCIVTICQTSPSGEFAVVGQHPVKFNGLPSNIASVVGPVVIKWDKEGEYLFDIFLDGRFCTRMSLTIDIEKILGSDK